MCGPVRASPGGRVEKIVAAGGWDGSRKDIVEIFDITENTWTTGGSISKGVNMTNKSSRADQFSLIIHGQEGEGEGQEAFLGE